MTSHTRPLPFSSKPSFKLHGHNVEVVVRGIDPGETPSIEAHGGGWDMGRLNVRLEGDDVLIDFSHHDGRPMSWTAAFHKLVLKVPRHTRATVGSVAGCVSVQ